MRNLPIVFIHRGTHSYLACALHQAKVRNPDAQIVLIGTVPIKISGIEFIPLAEYSFALKEFEVVYQHLSSNTRDFELFCFQRWFVLRQFMHERNLNEVIHCDSDLLLFVNVREEANHFKEYDAAIGSSSSYSGHFCWATVKYINDLCQYFIDSYCQAESIAYLRGFFVRHRTQFGPGGVCDMTLIGKQVQAKLVHAKELNSIVEGSVYDQSVSENRVAGCNEIFEMQRGMKSIFVEDKGPYFKTVDGRMIRAKTMHFQGGSKIHMRRFVEQPTWSFRVAYGQLKVLESLAVVSSWIRFWSRHCTRALMKRLRLSYWITRER